MPLQSCAACGVSFEVAVRSLASVCIDCAAREPDPAAPLIIVADDDGSTARWLRDVLQVGGYRVRLATDGGAALRLVAAERPALVLTDLQMPGGDGWQLVEQLRAQHPTVPVGVLTAETRAPRGVPAIRKPVRIDALLRFVATCRARERSAANPQP